MDDWVRQGIIFRQMRENDIDGVIAVENRSFSIPWTRGMFLEELENPCAVYYVAAKGDSIVAYAGVWIILDEAHITNIAVDPAYRGHRIASGLMRKILETARGLKLRSVTLEVREGNTAAITMYKSFGFRTEGRRKAYYSDNHEDALIMWYYLDESGGAEGNNGDTRPEAEAAAPEGAD